MYDLMGIDRNGISEMQEAVKNYKEKIDGDLEQLTSQVDYAQAFKGVNLAENMKTYLDAVIAEIKKMTSYIDDFKSSLDTVAANYENEAGTIASDISIDASGVQGVEVTTTTGVNGYASGAGSN